MSLAVDTLTDTTTDVPETHAADHPPAGRSTAGKFAVAFLATLMIGSGLRAIGESGVNTAIDNYYAKQAAAYAVPVSSLAAATNSADDVSTDVVTAAQ